MANTVAGKLVNQIEFKINKKSWDNLTRFQQKITNVKRQLSGLNGSIKVNAVVNQINKVTGAAARASSRMYDAHTKSYEKHVKDRNRIESQIAYREQGSRFAFQRRELGADTTSKKLLGGGREAAFASIALANNELRQGSITLREYNQKVNNAVQSQMRMARVNAKNAMSMRDVRTELVQLTAAYSAFALGANIFRTGKELQSLEAGMLIFAGDKAGVRENMQFLIDESDRLGTNFMVAAEQYTKFATVASRSMSKAQTREIFTAFSEIATTQQMDGQRFHRGMNALMQIMSKGQLMAEEVKGQFAESVYGGVNLFADALGMTTKEFMKAMESGQLMSDEVLPKLAIQMKKVANTNGALAEAQQSVNAQQQRFLTQVTLTKKAMFEGGFGKSMADAFKIMADFMKDNKEGFSAIGGTIGGAIKAIVSALNIALQPIMLLVKLFNTMFGDAGAKVLGTVIAVTTMSKAVSAMAATFALANLGFMTLVRNIAKYGVITTGFLAVEDIYTGAKGGRAISSESGFTSWSKNTMLGKAFVAQSPLLSLINNFAERSMKVDVTVNDGEFAKAVDVKVRQASEDSIANTAAKLGG